MIYTVNSYTRKNQVKKCSKTKVKCIRELFSVQRLYTNNEKFTGELDGKQCELTRAFDSS